MGKANQPSPQRRADAEPGKWRGQETRPGPGVGEAADGATRAEGNARITVEEALRRSAPPDLEPQSSADMPAFPANVSADAPDADAEAERKREAAAEEHAATQPHGRGKL